MPKPALEVALAAGGADNHTNPLRRALWLEALGQQLHRHLPPMLASHCQLANVDGSRLVFLVDSPLWHAKLRFASQQVIVAAQKIGLQVNQLSIKTAKTTLPFAPPLRSATTGLASQTTRRGLQQVLACFTDEPNDQPHTHAHPSGNGRPMR